MVVFITLKINHFILSIMIHLNLFTKINQNSHFIQYQINLKEVDL
jgi:hypothetical protein